MLQAAPALRRGLLNRGDERKKLEIQQHHMPLETCPEPIHGQLKNSHDLAWYRTAGWSVAVDYAVVPRVSTSLVEFTSVNLAKSYFAVTMRVTCPDYYGYGTHSLSNAALCAPHYADDRRGRSER